MMFVIRQLCPSNLTHVLKQYVHKFEGNGIINGVIGVFDFRCIQQ